MPKFLKYSRLWFLSKVVYNDSNLLTRLIYICQTNKNGEIKEEALISSSSLLKSLETI